MSQVAGLGYHGVGRSHVAAGNDGPAVCGPRGAKPMTESDWRACQEPQKMLVALRATGKASERKLRLFAVACFRRVWDLVVDGRSQRAVEVAERYADGLASDEEVGEAWKDAIYAANGMFARPGFSPSERLKRTAYAAGCAAAVGWDALTSATEVVDPGVGCLILRDIFGPLPFCPVTLPRPPWPGTTAVSPPSWRLPSTTGETSRPSGWASSGTPWRKPASATPRCWVTAVTGRPSMCGAAGRWTCCSPRSEP